MDLKVYFIIVVIMTDLNSYKKCTRCKSNKLPYAFGINSKGEPNKTCEFCRIKNKVNTEKYSEIISNINEVKHNL